MILEARVLARVVQARLLIRTIAVVKALLARAFRNAARLVRVAIRAVRALALVRALVVAALGAVSAREGLLLALVHVRAAPIKHHHVALRTGAVTFAVRLVAVDTALVLRAGMG